MKDCLKKLVRKSLVKTIDHFGWDYAELSVVVDYSPADKEIINYVRPFTMTNHKRLYALIQAVRYAVACGIPGAVVECGVYKGGSMMAAAKTLLDMNCRDRLLYLYDTYEGMAEPTLKDRRYDGNSALGEYRSLDQTVGRADWCRCSLQEVRSNMARTGYDPQNTIFVKGKVEETIPATLPDRISLLRLDTDWYESTRHELEHLYPRLAPGGILIIDDYGHWEGVAQAVDEYIKQNRLKLFLNRVDYACRIGVKLG